MPDLYIGVMSGTSLDGADAVLADHSGPVPRVIASGTAAFPERLRSRLLDLCTPGRDGLDEAGECSLALADAYAEAIHAALARATISAGEVRAIGCHGQTVRHRPERGFTIQLNDPARLAERTGIAVVADFRRRDMAAGGQGAPLVPLFHDAVFRDGRLHRVVVNIGGIANATFLRPGALVTGFDTGPGNVLMDAWVNRHLGKPFDRDGRWAATGLVQDSLLKRLLDEPYLAAPPPKSTGRELFHEDWLAARLQDGLRPADVQATLLEFTARSIVHAITRHAGGPHQIYLCGGGARNLALVDRIAQLALPASVQSTDALGVPSGLVEALAFSWLAAKCVRGEPLDLGPVTGAAHPCILGALYPA